MGRKMPAQNSQGTSVVIENEGGLDIVQADNGKEIRYTRDYGVGLDVHSKFIEVNVLVKNNLSVFEYHKSFKTDWASVNKANQWVVDTIVKYSDPAVDMSNGLHYTLESTSSYHQLVITAWKGIPCIVNPNLARAGRKKSDILDSKTLSISDLTGVWPSSYIPSIDAVELRMLVDERRYFTRCAIRINNRINNSLLKLGINAGFEGSVSKNSNLRSKIEDMLDGNISSFEDESIPPPPTVPEDILCIFKEDYEQYDKYRKLADEYFDRII